MAGEFSRFPIGSVIFQPALAITSVSPPSASAGDPAFTLTVNGSGFSSGCSVQWNGSPRPTTFVGSTQVTAAITAADIQTQGTATITVASVTPAATSAGVTFSIIPSITDILSVLDGIASMTAAQFSTQQPTLAGAESNLHSYLTNQEAAINGLNAQLSAANAQTASLTSQNASLSQQVQQQATQITQLQSQLAAASNQAASPLEIAQSLKSVVDQIQQTAASTPGMQATLTNLNVQMKTLLSVARDTPTSPAEAQLVFPDPNALPDPATLSTVSLSFGAIPNLQAASAASSGAPASAGASGPAPSNVPAPPRAQMGPVPPRRGSLPPDGNELFDDPAGRRQWFRRSRALRDGQLPAGLIGRESIKKRRFERALRRQRRMLMQALGTPAAPSMPEAAQALQPGAAPLRPAPPGGPGTTNWSLLGPDQVAGGAGGAQLVVVSGRITSLAVGPGGSRIYAGAANGGVWYSADGAATWTPLDQYSTMSPTETQPLEADSLSVGAIAVLFGAAASSSSSDSSSASAGGIGAFADTIYVGTGEANGNLDAYYGIGIKRSTDGGQTFTVEGTNLSTSEVYRIVIDPVDPTIVFAATTTGIYRRPAGPDFSNWTKVTDPDSNLANSAITDLVVAGTGQNRAYYAATVNQVFQSSDIFKNADGTATWTAINGITNPSANPLNNPLRKALAAGENDTSVVYCLVQGQSGQNQADFTLFRLDSTSGGAFLPVTIPANVSLLGGFGWYDIVVAVDPGNANTVYLLGSATLESNKWALAMYKGTLGAVSGGYAFTGSGPTWIGTGVHPDGHTLAFATNADGTHDGTNVWVGCDGGVFQSTASGSAGSFAAKNVGLSITQITYFSLRADTADELYAGCQDNGTLRYTVSSTPPWYQSGGGDGGGVAINPASTSQIIRQYTFGSLEVSTDDGATWGAAQFPTSSIDWGQMRDPNVLASYTEYNAGPFYGPVRALLSGSKTLVAFGTNRLWLRPDWSDPWVTLPTNSNPYSGATPNTTQDVLDTNGANVTAIAFGSPTMILFATSGGRDPQTQAGQNGKIWRLDQQADGSWTSTQQPAIINLPAPQLVFITALAVEDATRGSFYAALGSAGGEHILYFDGSQWHSAGLVATTLDVPAHAIAIHPADPNTLFLGTDVGVWKGVKTATPSSSSSSSSDSSASGVTTLAWTWTPFSDGLPEAAIQDLAIQPTAQKLRAATHGRGVWEIPIDWPSSSSSSSSDSSSSDSSSSSSSSSDSSSSDSSSSDSSSSDSSSSDSSSSDSSSSDSSSSDSSSSDSSSSDSSSSDSGNGGSSSSDSGNGDSSSSDSGNGDSSSSDSGNGDSSSSDSGNGDSSSSDSGNGDSSSSDSGNGDSSSSDSGNGDSSSSDSGNGDSSSSDSGNGDSSSSDSGNGDSSSSDSGNGDSSSSDSGNGDSSSSDSGNGNGNSNAPSPPPRPAAKRKRGWLSWLRP